MTTTRTLPFAVTTGGFVGFTDGCGGLNVTIVDSGTIAVDDAIEF